MILRNGILAGLLLSAATIAFSFGRILLELPGLVLYMAAVLVAYGYVVFQGTRSTDDVDKRLLKRAMYWGLAIGACAAAAAIFINMTPFPEFAVAAALFALLIPVLAGAIDAVGSVRISFGIRIGLWSGLMGSLIAFLALAAAGYLAPVLAGEPVFATLEADEYGALVLATFTLFLYGPICPWMSAVGGCLGILLHRTGRTPTDGRVAPQPGNS